MVTRETESQASCNLLDKHKRYVDQKLLAVAALNLPYNTMRCKFAPVWDGRPICEIKPKLHASRRVKPPFDLFCLIFRCQRGNPRDDPMDDGIDGEERRGG